MKYKFQQGIVEFRNIVDETQVAYLVILKSKLKLKIRIYPFI